MPTGPTYAIDHLAVVARTLDEGVDHVRHRIGVELAPGGRHPLMGTHNRLLSLGPSEYLEVIAIDPDAPPPDRPRWFGLDELDGAPRLATWIVRTDDVDSCLDAAPGACGHGTTMTRGDLRWRISIADDGRLPFDGAHPSFIQWPVGPHPAASMPVSGCALAALRVAHPDGSTIASVLGRRLCDERVSITDGPLLVEADIATPNGLRTL